MAKPYHEEKKAYKRMKRKLVTPWKTLGIICLVLALILAPMTIVLTMFDNTIALFTGAYFWELVDEDPNAQYFKPDFATDQERLDRGFELVKQVEGEGAALPLCQNRQSQPFQLPAHLAASGQRTGSCPASG